MFIKGAKGKVFFCFFLRINSLTTEPSANKQYCRYLQSGRDKSRCQIKKVFPCFCNPTLQRVYRAYLAIQSWRKYSIQSEHSRINRQEANSINYKCLLNNLAISVESLSPHSVCPRSSDGSWFQRSLRSTRFLPLSNYCPLADTRVNLFSWKPLNLSWSSSSMRERATH